LGLGSSFVLVPGCLLSCGQGLRTD